MARYEVLLIDRPEGWQPLSPDDVPPEPGPAVETLRQTDDLFAAVRRAVVYNEQAQREPRGASSPRRSWAVVVEPGTGLMKTGTGSTTTCALVSPKTLPVVVPVPVFIAFSSGQPGTVGRSSLRARLCTPLAYKVAALWWPTGWEPQSPLDVPNCAWKAHGDPDPKPLSYAQATAIVRGLNEQGMTHAGAMWYVVIAVENEPVLQTISHDASGTETTVEVRRLHVVRPEEGSGPGDCSHCPAGSIPCRGAEPDAGNPTLQTIETRKA
jgi:hypothetical protein